MTVTEMKPLGVRHSELMDEIEEAGGRALRQRADSLVGELRAKTETEAVANVLGGRVVEGVVILEEGERWGPAIEIPLRVTEPKPSTGRIHLIPRYWGGEGANGDLG